MLDDFSAVKLDQTKAAPSATGAATSAAPAPAASSEQSKDAPVPPQPDANLSEEDFAKQLQAGMADLLGELENSVRIGYNNGCQVWSFHALTSSAPNATRIRTNVQTDDRCC